MNLERTTVLLRNIKVIFIASWKKMSAKKQKSLEDYGSLAKKQKTEEPAKDNLEIINEIKESRLSCASSIKEFKFNKKRVRVLSEAKDISDNAQAVIYWMSRDQRVQDNWAFLYAQHLALRLDLPLCVCFCLVPKFLDATIRHYRFMLEGLKEVSKECESLNIHFHVLLGEAKTVLPAFVKENNVGGIVTDFCPLRVPRKWVSDVLAKLPEDVPLCQVDAHNIVPCWIASDKQEYGARTIRKKIHDKLKEYLTEFPSVIKQKQSAKDALEPVDWNTIESNLEVNMDVKEVAWAKPGTTAGLCKISEFCKSRLKSFNDLRNDPTKNNLSDLSPWFHFGQISIQRTILQVLKFKSKYGPSVDAFVEEAVIRRELADNFCYYNKNYDKVEGAYDWAKKTLKDHSKDKREYIYTKDQFENAETHDLLWNAAQRQMVKEGKMHGFLRMYWAKKILEWTNSPEEALEFAIYLNDKYELDGRDPNGYVGCMWSICGIHDQGWAERAVFGKIRFMNYKGCTRKFDVNGFIAKYREK
ncbi:deoxyribodipyrimidine photo-lyase [Caerostris darwini]|uniref:Deoxyribodipyrimidine photo-lyase n=1 Tax=Caerostris darwini TaxID=1538125 RepID=A0AAV4SNQ4_9ARAC|nr:deoxyribodipyrimidine photo-lyase [Caerostris darwini]